MIIAIEGVDGSGKGTQTRRLLELAREKGVSAASFTFPQYESSFFSGIITNYLNGVYGPKEVLPPIIKALLFSAERFECRDALLDMADTHDLLIIDRYVASNLAYQTAGLEGAEKEDLIRDVLHMEMDIFRLPSPDLNVFLDVDPGLAQKKVGEKGARDFLTEAYDAHERDLGFLRQVYDGYRHLAGAGRLGAWEVIPCQDGAGDLLPPGTITQMIWEKIEALGLR